MTSARAAAGIGALFALLFSACARPGAVSPAAEPWAATWLAPMQLTEPRNMPPAPGLTGTTLRQVLRVSIGGTRLRVRLSNIFGHSPAIISTAHLARSAGGSAIDGASDRALTFGGSTSVTMAPGEAALSDPLEFPVDPLTDLAVTLQISAAPEALTGHPGSRTTSYFQPGDHVTAPALPEAIRTEHWYLITGVEVVAPDAHAVITLGNSITDGRGSGTDRNNRWPDNLARRLRDDPRTRRVAMLNAGIGGNTVLTGGLGPTALTRLDRDVLDQRGARWLIVLEGVNDIGNARDPGAPAQVADGLIGAYQQIITRAHARGIRVYGATILPFAGSMYGGAEREAARQTVNQWIRGSGAFDAVIDFDAALRDPQQPDRLRPEADTGDHLHPNEAGYVLMAAAIDLRLFSAAR